MFTVTRYNELVVIAVLAVLVSIMGCGGQDKIEDLSDQRFDDQKQAVSLYVDATMFAENNDNDKAIEILESVIELDPKFALAYSLKGDLCQASEEYGESADAYEMATELDPWSFKDFYNLGKVTQMTDQFGRAIRAYVTACELEPRHYESRINAAKCYFEVDDMDKAMEYGTIAKDLNPDAADADLLFGDVFKARQDHDNAIVAYRRALELEGNKPRVMVPLAVVYLVTNRLEEGKKLLGAAIEIDPTYAIAHQHMGYAHLKQKAVDRAIASYETAAKLQPGDWKALKGLGVAYMLKAAVAKDDAYKAKGLALWEKSLEIKPDQPELRKMYSKYTSQ